MVGGEGKEEDEQGRKRMVTSAKIIYRDVPIGSEGESEQK